MRITRRTIRRSTQKKSPSWCPEQAATAAGFPKWKRRQQGDKKCAY
jgi:hypothetical protein